MLLAVAGLTDKQIRDRFEQLASGDWSNFSPEERVAFSFAWKQAVSPSSITDADVKQLIEQLGKEQAVDLIWWTSRGHYMTRVADAFQLPLESDNVFMALSKSK